MKAANIYLNFEGNTEEAFKFYKSVFGGEFLNVIRFKEFAAASEMPIPDDVSEKIMHISLPLGKENILMGTDALESMGHSVTMGNNVYINLDTESAEEAERLFNGLSEGGEGEMSLQATEWAEKFASFKDKFGVRWMINYAGSAQFGSNGV